MIFFEFKQVVKIHTSLISETGGIDGIRDENLLDSALKAPFQTFDGRELYPEIIEKLLSCVIRLLKNDQR